MRKIIKIYDVACLFWGHAVAYVGTIAQDAKRVEDLDKAVKLAKNLNDLQVEIHDNVVKKANVAILQRLINDFKKGIDTARSLALQVVTLENKLREFTINLTEMQSKKAGDVTKNLSMPTESLSELSNKTGLLVRMKFMIKKNIIVCFIVASVGNSWAVISRTAIEDRDFESWAQGLRKNFNTVHDSIIKTLGSNKATAEELEKISPSVLTSLGKLQTIIDELNTVIRTKKMQGKTITDYQIKEIAQPIYRRFVDERVGLKSRYSVVLNTIETRYKDTLSKQKSTFDLLCKRLESMKIDPTDAQVLQDFSNELGTANDVRNEYGAIVKLLQSIGKSGDTNTMKDRLNALRDTNISAEILKGRAEKIQELLTNFDVQAANQVLTDIAEPLAKAEKNKNINLTQINRLIGQLNVKLVGAVQGQLFNTAEALKELQKSKE